jgi:hypothetical protein
MTQQSREDVFFSAYHGRATLYKIARTAGVMRHRQPSCIRGVLPLLASLLLVTAAAADEAAPVEPAPPKPTSAAAAAGPPEREGTEPLWEIGLVGGGGWLPDYPAAGQNHWNGIALPYAIYRGDFLQLGERGIVRGLFVDLRHLEFDLSADAAFPVDSSDNRARERMPDLDTLFELGPRLIYKFLPRSSGRELDLSLAARAVVSTDLVNWRYQGVVINPGLTWLSLVAGINPLFGLDRLNRYFYQVKPRFARLAGPPTTPIPATSAPRSPLARRGRRSSACACLAASCPASTRARPTRTARSIATTS